jgi:hypothetical protein
MQSSRKPRYDVQFCYPATWMLIDGLHIKQPGNSLFYSQTFDTEFEARMRCAALNDRWDNRWRLRWQAFKRWWSY